MQESVVKGVSLLIHASGYGTHLSILPAVERGATIESKYEDIIDASVRPHKHVEGDQE